VGADFNPTQFAETVKKAHIDSVTVFARCHHGFLYYHSNQHKELVHPTLKKRKLEGRVKNREPNGRVEIEKSA
jgi:hypothetical protein